MKRKLIATVAVACIAWLGLRSQDMKYGKHLTASEYKELLAKDAVLQFMERVNKRAVADPIWNQNYTLALYNAFGEEGRAHLRDLGIESYETELP